MIKSSVASRSIDAWLVREHDGDYAVQPLPYAASLIGDVLLVSISEFGHLEVFTYVELGLLGPRAYILKDETVKPAQYYLLEKSDQRWVYATQAYAEYRKEWP